MTDKAEWHVPSRRGLAAAGTSQPSVVMSVLLTGFPFLSNFF